MAFNLFPQTDFRQMDLGWFLHLLKKISEQSVNPEELEKLRDDVDSLQVLVDKLIANQIFTTPEEHGAVGDGETDDTVAVQAAIDDVKPVFMGKTYGITDTIHINSDKLVICGEDCLIITLAPMLNAIIVGDDPATGPDAGLEGLVQVFWYGGTLRPIDDANIFTNGFVFERSFQSYFYGVTVKECYGTGFRWQGTYGASTICDHCTVRGPAFGHYGICGFKVARNDQRVTNASVINMLTGFYSDRGHVKFDNCACWLTRVRDDEIANVVGYDIIASMCSVQNCSVDTLPTGFLIHPSVNNFTASTITWLTQTGIIPEGAVEYTLFKGSETGVATHGFVSGIQAINWPEPARILKDVSGLTIIGFECHDTTNYVDYPGAITQLMPNYNGAEQRFLSGRNGVYEWFVIDDYKLPYVKFSYNFSSSESGFTKDYYNVTEGDTTSTILTKFNNMLLNNQMPAIIIDFNTKASPNSFKRDIFIVTRSNNDMNVTSGYTSEKHKSFSSGSGATRTFDQFIFLVTQTRLEFSISTFVVPISS